MGKPLILYKTAFRSSGAVVTAAEEASGFPIENIYDFRSYSLWKATSTGSVTIDIDLGAGNTETTDYILIVNHNLNTLGKTVTIARGASFPPVGIEATFAPAEDTVSLHTWTQSAAYRYWRVSMGSGGAVAPWIGECFLGNKLTLPQFLEPSFDPFLKQIEVVGSRSRGGHYLGASLRGQMHRGEITFGEAGTPRSDFTSDLNAFLDDHAFLRRPFGLVVDPDDSDFDSARYVRVPDEAEIDRRAVGGTWENLALRLPFEEAFMEPAS